MGLEQKRMIKELSEVTLPERKREVQEICGADVSFDVDWASMDNDSEVLRFLDNLSCHRLNMALRSIAIDPMGKEALRDGLKSVRLRNVAALEDKKMSFAGGVLEMQCAYTLRLDGCFSDMEIYRELMRGL